ncbi:hypothetical protein Ac2012v2_004403 [Leucoagaricus gongylophorus]
MPQTSDPVSRGRTQVAKPLAAVSAGLTAATTSTRTKPRLSAAITSAERRKSAKLTSTVDVLAKVPCQVGIEKRTVSVRHISTKPKSQPLKPHLSKEPSEKPTAKEISEDNSTPPPVGSGSAATDILSESGDVNPSSKVTTQDPSDALYAADALQVATQTYPWLYMSSMLDACFTEAERSAKKELDTLGNQVSQDEVDFADEKALYESQRLIEFCGELNSSTFAKEAPAIMQSFTAFGEICETIEAETLQLAMATPNLESEEPLQVYNAMMERLNDLQEQASELESSILSLTESNITSPVLVVSPEVGVIKIENEKTKKEDTNSAREQIIGVFVACLPVLRARKANLTMAQELIDSAQENLSLALRMESMGID